MCHVATVDGARATESRNSRGGVSESLRSVANHASTRRVLGFTRERMAALESGATPTAREYAMMAEAFDVAGFTVAHDGGALPEVLQCADCLYLWAADEEPRHSTLCDGEVPND